jgi:hypothetical protein
MAEMDGDVAQKVMYDVAGEVSIADSKLTYTPEMRQFRHDVEEEFAAWKKVHPDAVLHIPAEIPPADEPSRTKLQEADPPATPIQLAATKALDAESKGKAIDWFVDVDFPPIVQKALGDITLAVAELAKQIPMSIDGKRLTVGMLLNAMGSNDVDQTLDMVLRAYLENPDLLVPPAGQPGGPPLPVPGAPPGRPGPNNTQPAGRAAGKVAEASVERLRKLLDALRESDAAPAEE